MKDFLFLVACATLSGLIIELDRMRKERKEWKNNLLD